MDWLQKHGLPPPARKQRKRVRLAVLGWIVAFCVLEYAAFNPPPPDRSVELPAILAPRQAVAADLLAPCPSVRYE